MRLSSNPLCTAINERFLHVFKGGGMEDVLKTSALNPKQVLRVFYATCSAVAHMHSQQPPIVHRDLKVRKRVGGGGWLWFVVGKVYCIELS